MIRREVEIPAS